MRNRILRITFLSLFLLAGLSSGISAQQILKKKTLNSSPRQLTGTGYAEDQILINKKSTHFKEYHHNGNLLKEGVYEDGIKQDPFIWYYPDGLPMTIIHYVDGLLNGRFMTFYTTGVPEYEGIYSDWGKA